MILDVAVPVRVPGTFHYLANIELPAELGMGSVVEVPFGRSTTHAFVVGILNETDIASDKLKSVAEILVSTPIFDEAMLKFLRWVSDYYCHPLGEVIATALPRIYWAPHTAKRRKAKTSTESSVEFSLEAGDVPKPTLNEEQAICVKAILNPDEKRPYLLHGVTGSGKTEVYMSVMEEVLAAGKTAIILVPEIALTPQLTMRFARRFPGCVAIMHSELSPGERREQWARIQSGEAKIVIGARSAIFAPVKNLGLIVVDEEHETSFKQEESLRYHARDLAVVRGAMLGAKVILGSATPSLESYQNTLNQRYVHLILSQRVNKRSMPKTCFVDVKEKSQWFDSKTPWLSRVLVSAISERLERGEQTMLYLNRLGYAHFLFCSDCGQTWRCKNCDVSLTYYQNPPALKCHYCGVKKNVPHQCDKCQGTHLETMGLGTEQVEKTLKGIFKKAKIGRLDRGVVKGRKDLEQVLMQIARREIDIIIGTQMVTKGHDFPGISLVGILMADASLNLPDFRAHERTFQIITQVSGRAGRAELPGEVVVQTINPEHPVLLAASRNQYEEFYRNELNARKQFGFPPFHRSVLIRFQHTQPQKVEHYANTAIQFLKKDAEAYFPKCRTLGPAEAPLARLKKQHRWQCLVQSESVKELQALLKRFQAWDRKQKSVVQMFVDVDPVNLL